MDVCPFDSIAMVPTTDAEYAEGYFRIPEEIYESPDKFSTRRNNMDTITKDSPKVAAE